MPLYLSDSLSTIPVTVPDEDFNKYRVRQTRVESGKNDGEFLPATLFKFCGR